MGGGHTTPNVSPHYHFSNENVLKFPNPYLPDHNHKPKLISLAVVVVVVVRDILVTITKTITITKKIFITITK